MSHLAISLLGTFQVSLGSACISDFESNKVRALLAYLAVESDRPHTRDALAALLWPESAQDAALSSLRNALATLRRAIGDREASPSFLLINRETVQFNPASDSRLDVAEIACQKSVLQQMPDQGAQANLQERISLAESYRGPFMEGFSIPDNSSFEEWVILWRERLEQWALEGLRWLANYYEACGKNAAALEYARRLIAIDPWLEDGHCQVMRLLALSGQREQAIRQYHSLREILKRDLEAQPSDSTTCLYQEILSGKFSAAITKPHPPHNLPVPTTSFIGREKETATLTQLILSGQTRLVTVTGAGGTGKTRIALRAAEELLDAFPQGVWLVELGALADPALVPAALASALSLNEAPDRSVLQVLVEYLRARRVLILLDTCEHLVGAVAHLVDQILRSSTQVVFLAISREILGVGGELPFFCPSLALPDPCSQHLNTAAERHAALVKCEAVRLFLERAALAAPAFVLTEWNASIIVQVCRRLDGIPLAIELAAARMRTLSIEQIAERLDHVFLLLTNGSRAALPRQQTLKAMIDWSYNLLSTQERALLLRLSVFSGGWALAAAEAVCAGAEAGLDSLSSEQIADLLGHLVDKSLVLAETLKGGEPRYRMLDTICLYAHERLLEAGGDAVLRGRHLVYFLQLAEQAEPHLRAMDALEWLKRLELELSNLRQALDWSLSTSIEYGLRLGAALYIFWHTRSRRFEGAHWLELLLAAEATGEAIQTRSVEGKIIRAKALVTANALNSYYPGVYAERARAQAKEGKAIFLQLGDRARSYLPFALFNTGETEEDFLASLNAAREAGDPFYAAESLMPLRYFSLEAGDLHQAETFSRENLEIRQRIGDKDGEAFAFFLLADLELLRGNFRQANELWEASQRCFRQIENDEFCLYTASIPVRAAITQGDYRRALALSETLLTAGQDISSSLVTADAIGFICMALWALGAYDEVPKRCAEVLGPDWQNCLPCGRKTIFYVFGRAAISQGDYSSASAYLRQALTAAMPEKFLAMQAFGIAAAVDGQTRRAAVIFGALERLCPWLRNVSSPLERSEYERAMQIACDGLGGEAFDAAWAEGLAMSPKQAAEFNLGE